MQNRNQNPKFYFGFKSSTLIISCRNISLEYIHFDLIDWFYHHGPSRCGAGCTGVQRYINPNTYNLFFSLIQFLLVPYSFFVSFGLIIADGPQIYFGHYLTFISIQMISNLLQYFCLPTSITSSLAQISSYFELPIGT